MTTKRSDNLCNFYILPLLGLNRSSFGGISNFINSYLTNDFNHVVVHLHNPYGPYAVHQHYKTDYYNNQGILTIVFSLPPQFKATAAKFKEGKYSQFSNEVKQLIKAKSGLKWQVPNGRGQYISAKKLLALDRDPDLRKEWERDLGVTISPDAELISIPSDNEFIDLEIMRVQQG